MRFLTSFGMTRIYIRLRAKRALRGAQRSLCPLSFKNNLSFRMERSGMRNLRIARNVDFIDRPN
jgi:hypothetical protein